MDSKHGISKTNSASRDLANLDLMRSVAVGIVVIPHTLLYMNPALIAKIWFLGFLGVGIFFVHTTLVLMWSLERDPHFFRFMLRRIFRIYPLWLFVLFFSVAVHLPTSPAYAPAFRFLHPTFRILFGNIFLIFNLFGSGGGLIGASWTLPVEMEMYFVLPFLFFAIRSMRSLSALLLLDLLAIAVAHAMEPKLGGDLIYCAPCFLPGALAYLAFQRRGPFLPGWSFVLWIAALITSFNYFASRHHDSFRSGWIFALLLGSSLPAFRQITLRPLVRVSALLARYSYGLYLWHFTAIALGLYYLKGYPVGIRILAYVTSIVVLPVASYHAVEEPMIRVGSRLARNIGNAREPVMNQNELKLEVAP